MPDRQIELGVARILVANDDGIEVRGIKLLEEIARVLTRLLWLDTPAIKLGKHYLDGEPIPWETAARFAPEVIRRLTRLPWPEHTLININFPATNPAGVAGFAVTSQGKRAIADNLTERFDPRGR